jgi:ADP-heptose:LPS heptosyltransferase
MVHTTGRSDDLSTKWRLLNRLRWEKFDLALDYSEGDRAAFWGLASGIPIRVGYRGKPSYFFRNLSHTHLLPDRAQIFDRHITSCHAEALNLFGVSNPEIPSPMVYFSNEASVRAGAFLAEAYGVENGLRPKAPYAVVQLYSHNISRRWNRKGCRGSSGLAGKTNRHSHSGGRVGHPRKKRPLWKNSHH